MDVARRTVLQASGLVAAGGLVAACGSGGDSAAPASSAASEASAAPASSAASAAPVGAVAAVADIPVGGGIVLENEAIVLTQPTAGQVLAFTAICTHQGCLVSRVENNEIICPCHGSRFSGTDGSVITGPAEMPLTSAGVTVDGGNVVLS